MNRSIEERLHLIAEEYQRRLDTSSSHSPASRKELESLIALLKESAEQLERCQSTVARLICEDSDRIRCESGSDYSDGAVA